MGIMEQIKQGVLGAVNTEAPRHCPCCGNAGIYSGATGATSFGVECKKCGLTISKQLPDTNPNGVSFSALVEIALGEAITAWNKRVVETPIAVEDAPMTDMDCLKKAAQVAGVVVREIGDKLFLDGSCHVWNPFKSNEDAFQLAVLLCLPLEIEDTQAAIYPLNVVVPYADYPISDPYKATRKAIVMAGVEMWKRQHEM